MTDNEVSINMSATSIADARHLLEKCLIIAATGELIPDGRLVQSDSPAGGCAQLYTWPRRTCPDCGHKAHKADCRKGQLIVLDDGDPCLCATLTPHADH
ncbi:hypothetical protein [Mycolicibacterium sphagni]|uniref:hypothetical protein n=1 Tax=Mycolicibacterium sphagni TaxID=1786 RepID=UPI0021F2A19B|nr:hypothetical protein [Mycolicibacterium sphagni]MCV7174799.1 hypothetical protein [Mycolicibacterium sphagni]